MRMLINDPKSAGAALIMLAWFVLVLTGQASAGQFVDALRDILLGLGILHGVSNYQRVKEGQ